MTSRREFLARTGVLAGAAALGFMPGTAGAGRRWSRGARASVILEWREIAPGVHVTSHLLSGGNVLVAAGESDVLVVDTKFPYAAGAIHADAVSLGPGTEAPTLINTHHHADHSSGNVAFREGSVRIAHPNAARRIEDQADRFIEFVRRAPEQVGRNVPENVRAMIAAEKLAEAADTLDASDWAPTVKTADGTTVKLGEMTASVHYFGAGHTDNDLVVRIDELNVVHMGDLVFNSLNPFFDREGGSTVHGWIESLRRSRELCDDNTIVVPGHGPIGDAQIIDAQIRYHEQLIDAVKTDIEAGLSKEDAARKQHDFMMGLGFMGVAPRAIQAVYDELTNAG